MTKRISLLLILLGAIGLTISAQSYDILISGPSSLVRVGMNPHPTESSDTLLANTLWHAITNERPDSIAFVRDAFQKKADDDLAKEKSWGALSYILNRMLLERSGKTVKKGDILTEDLYRFFTANGCEKLKHYLLIKYELNRYRPRSIKEHITQRTHYDDMLMFNDPTRGKWDMTKKIMKAMPVKKGDKVVDMGCGFGYNSLRLLDLVGPTGIVYATDTEEPYIKYVSDIMSRNGHPNLKAIHTQTNNLGVDDEVDCIFINSLYHVLYTWSREDERKAMLTSIKERLKPNGYIVVVDNYNRNGEELNNCHVDPRLIQAQLGFWGFETVSLKKMSEQRYMLIMRRNDNFKPSNQVKAKPGEQVLSVKGQKSVIHIGSLDSYDITDRGIAAAQMVYDFMGGGDRSLAETAIKKYNELIPDENFGGEYTAMQWLCEAKLASDEQRSKMLEDPLTKSFYNYLTKDSCKVLRYYLLHKYKLGNDSIRMMSDSLLEKSGEVGRTHRSFLEDYILALNPKRPSWENTQVFLDNINLKPGQVIADIGSGSGYYTHKFSRMVGNEGKVYALEMKEDHMDRLKSFISENGITNIEVIVGKEDNLELPCQVDKMFMCSLYHIMYGVISDSERDAYLKSMVKYLKPDGELIIVDNSPVDDDTLPYHGPYISRELIEHQLSFYGLELTDYVQVIPQRFLLKFKFKK